MATAKITAVADLQTKGFDVGLARMNQGVQRFASGQLKQLGGMIGGAFAVRAVIDFGKEMMTTADAIDNTAKQLGVGVEELQALQRETELTAGSAEKMTAALLKLAKSQANAAGGEATQIRAFKQLGISMQEIQSLDPARLFELVAQKVSKAGATSKEASGASLILGRSYVELNSVIDKVANEGLENLKNQMLDANQIMSSDAVAAADAMEEAFNRATRSMTNTLREWSVGALNIIDRVNKAILDIQQQSLGSRLKQALGAFVNPVGFLSGFAGKASGQGGSYAQTMTGGGPIKKKDITDDPAAFAEKMRAVSSIQASDQLAKIGGILGGQAMSSQERTAKESLSIQRNMDQKLTMIADTSKITSENTTSLKED